MLLLLAGFALLAWIRHDASPASLARKEEARHKLRTIKHKERYKGRGWGNHHD